MLEYLTEELHSHLYLKSLYTESRWKAHTPQQTDRKHVSDYTAATRL